MGKLGMPLEVNTMIVTKGKEKRISDNFFELEKLGYRIYPIDVPIAVRKQKKAKHLRRILVNSFGKIIKLSLNMN